MLNLEAETMRKRNHNSIIKFIYKEVFYGRRIGW